MTTQVPAPSTPRRVTRRELLLSAAAAAATARVWGRELGPAELAQAALIKAVDFLWSQQADDGGWHSPQYGVMRSGQSLTPFVLHALLGTIEDMSSDQYGRVQHASRFILAHLDDEGVLGRFDKDVTEYPVYSTAYALQCLQRAQVYRRMLNEAGDRAIDAMQRYLADAQFHERAGFAPESPAYGGWGFDRAARAGHPGHMDLSHTRRALEALVPGGESLAILNVRRRAEAFLRVVQKHPDAAAKQPLPPGRPPSDEPPPFDGGFYFSPVVLDANKGGLEESPTPHWRSYATATCDGVLALLAAGVPRHDKRMTAAVDWLRQYNNLEYPEGIPEDDPDPWGPALRFYHYAVRAEVYRRLEFAAADIAQLAAAVTSRQRPEGSFVNVDSPLMKEDDPVLCTALAVVALSNCLM